MDQVRVVDLIGGLQSAHVDPETPGNIRQSVAGFNDIGGGWRGTLRVGGNRRPQQRQHDDQRQGDQAFAAHTEPPNREANNARGVMLQAHRARATRINCTQSCHLQ
jgi:hypothetical protein